jgi:hypothetical protein
VNKARFSKIKNNPHYLAERDALREIPDGQEYYEYVIKNVELDPSNSQNSYIMWVYGKVDELDMDSPCKFVEANYSLPDIDVDFPPEYRQEAIDYVVNKYGEANTCQIVTFSRMMGKSAVRAVMQAEGGYPMAIIDSVTENIPDEAKISDQIGQYNGSVLQWVLHEAPKLVSDYVFLEDEELQGEYADVFRKALMLEGTYKSKGKHAAGFIISSVPIDSLAPMDVDKHGDLIAGLDMGDLEQVGLVKFDFLGVDILSKVQEVLGSDLSIYPLSDAGAFEVLHNGNTKGCFQLENRLGSDWCKSLKPNNIDQISDVISLIRPGCISGDTLISTKMYYKSCGKHTMTKRTTIKEIHDYLKIKKRNGKNYKYQTILSFDGNGFVDNDLLDIYYSGEKECFKVKFSRYSKGGKKNRSMSKYSNLECTKDHKLLTNTGWKKLEELVVGDRILVFKESRSLKPRLEMTASRHTPLIKHKNTIGLRSYKEICYKNYKEECCICGWNEASLDTHHIDGDRYVDNTPENLCFFCPNCHRKESQGLISVEAIRDGQYENKLEQYEKLEWATFCGVESVGIKSTYDISMKSPHNNFIAGNVVVHNSLHSKEDGKNMPEHYKLRKFGEEGTPRVNDIVDKILKPTYGIIVYQEQAMRVCRAIAGFTMSQANKLRKAAGKKNASLMEQVKTEFMAGCLDKGVDEDTANYIFNMIESSNRYSFNASHGVSYSYLSYYSAYAKKHKPLEFYRTWLNHAKNKIKPFVEVQMLCMSAKIDKVEILPPSAHYKETEFFIHDDAVVYGLRQVKGASKRELEKLFELMVDDYDYIDYLHLVFPNVNKRTVEALIDVGGFDYLGKSRSELKHLYSCLSALTDKEREWIIKSGIRDIKKALLKCSVPKKEGGGASTKRRTPKILDILDRIENPGRDLRDNPSTIAQREESLMGVALSVSYMDACTTAEAANTTCKEFADGKGGKMILVVRVKEAKEHTTKNGDTMAFLTVEDDSCQMEMVVFSKEYEEFSSLLYPDSTIVVVGERSKKGSFVASRIVEA